MPTREILVWDEGLCHRALSLWGRWPGPTPADEIAANVAALPPPARVFHVTTDPARRIDRMRIRGFAPFVDHADRAEIAGKMERLQTVAEQVHAALARRGVSAVRIPNAGAPTDNDAILQAAAADLTAVAG